MQTTSPVADTRVAAVEAVRQVIATPQYIHQHRAHAKDFTRERLLTFNRVVVLLLRKTIRSIQLHLHEFFERLCQGDDVPLVTASAWTQARSKFRHTGFIEINRQAILKVAYDPGTDFEVRRWCGRRLLAIDSSLLHLPNERAIGEQFGWAQCENHTGLCGRYAQGRLSVLYDVLNGLAIDAQLGPWTTGERAMAANHLSQTTAEDVCLLDRGYTGYETWARFIAAQRHFICRCQHNVFGVVRDLYRLGQAEQSRVVELKARQGIIKQIREAALPETIVIRFVTVRLSTGELEVLATSLLDESLFPTECFLEAYGCRWGIETYFDVLKNRLALEHFSGQTIEAVQQDLHATVLLSNLETVMIRPAQKQLQQQSQERKHPAQVNHAVSFHTIKVHLIELLLGSKPVEEVIERIERLFLSNPVAVRPNRDVPRRKRSGWRSYWWQRNTRKAVF